MAPFDADTIAITKRLQDARLSLLQKQPFYALLLMNMKFALDPMCETSYTDGERIGFNADYIKTVTDTELEFLLMHEVLHTALGHPFRQQENYDREAFDLACDIVVNSNILHSFNGMPAAITINGRVAPHRTPNGDEGCRYTLEQVYEMVLNAQKKKPTRPSSSSSQTSSSSSGTPSSMPTPSRVVPADPQKPTRQELDSLIALLLRQQGQSDPPPVPESEPETFDADDKPIDDHSYWEGDDNEQDFEAVWMCHTINAVESVKHMPGCGTLPLGADRMLEQLREPILDWRTVLDMFIQEDVCDYSFSPPDRRMEDCPFFLPDFNETAEVIGDPKNVLFMIDTSGSMSIKQITECYSEIYGAIMQFDGKLQGLLGFFDASVTDPIPFETEEEFKIIHPKGGGGTSFHCIFRYVREHMQDKLPATIVILTDGFAPFPPEEDAMDIPVLWIINNDLVSVPWGKVARLIEKKS